MRTTFASVVAGAAAAWAWTEIHHNAFMNKNVDAIVKPGAYNSHMHTFFGSDAITNEMPTSADLQDGCFSGENPNDLSAYWTPTLYYVKDGVYTEVPILRLSTYYTNAGAEIPIPQNFAMISGNASAQTQADADHHSNNLEWFCEGTDERSSDIASLPASTCESNIQVSLVFPNCVNPDNLEEYDFTDPSTGRCPDNMKQMPQLRYAIKYQWSKVVPEGWSGTAPFQLSCATEIGNGYCFHGDFINGWFEDAAENMLIEGGSGYNDGQFVGGSHGDSAAVASCTPTDADPENGTSDYLESVRIIDSDDDEQEIEATLTSGVGAEQPTLKTKMAASTLVDEQTAGQPTRTSSHLSAQNSAIAPFRSGNSTINRFSTRTLPATRTESKPCVTSAGAFALSL